MCILDIWAKDRYHINANIFVLEGIHRSNDKGCIDGVQGRKQMLKQTQSMQSSEMSGRECEGDIGDVFGLCGGCRHHGGLWGWQQ